MATHPLAGKPAPRSLLVDVPRLVSAYYTAQPDPNVPSERVSFGTSGHRGSSLDSSFNEPHLLATTQAICDYRRAHHIDGSLFLGPDTHALSVPAMTTALEVLAAHGVMVRIDEDGGPVPTPVISHAILRHNRGRTTGRADGIVITPSHNPPRDGGIKYNPPHGGPAEQHTTRWIQDRANELLAGRCAGVRRIPYARAARASCVARHDYVGPYVADLANVIDLALVAAAKLEIGVDPMGGSGLSYWSRIAERYGLDIELVSDVVDPTFGFMTVDHDGKIRMDCSSPHAMARLIGLKDRYDVAFGNDPDYDRHGIVTRSGGLLSPNHYLSAAIAFLFRQRPAWGATVAVGKTLVSSSMIDRVARDLGRTLFEVPVGFKWFVDGLLGGSIGFGGEESAGASFLRRDGSVWTTDKDGIILDLLAAEMTAKTGRDPAQLYGELVAQFGGPVYRRTDAAATPAQKVVLAKLSPGDVAARTLAGEPIVAAVTTAPGNGAPIGGLKVVAENGWFAARPSGTESVYKIYAESFRDEQHLATIEHEAQAIVSAAFTAAGV